MDRLGGTIGSHDYDDNDYGSGSDDSVAEPPPSPVGQDERRMQVRAYNHWAGLLGDANFPAIEDLEPEKLTDFGPYSVLLDFTAGVEDPAIRFLGEQLAGECDADDKIETLSDVPSLSLLSRITDHYMQILANQAPIGFEAEFVNQRQRTVLYRGILLPFSSDGAEIDFIFGVINWKEMAAQDEADELLLEMGQALSEDVIGEDVAGTEDMDDEVLELDSGLVADPDADLSELTSAMQNDDDSASPLVSGEAFALAGNNTQAGSNEVEDGVLDLGDFAYTDHTPTELPVPAFGRAAIDPPEHEQPAETNAETADEEIAYDDFSALDDDGNPYDYGLPDLDDEPPVEDVDDVVDPLADEHAGIGLTSLVNRGDKPKAKVGLALDDLAAAQQVNPEPEAAEREEADFSVDPEPASESVVEAPAEHAFEEEQSDDQFSPPTEAEVETNEVPWSEAEETASEPETETAEPEVSADDDAVDPVEPVAFADAFDDTSAEDALPDDEVEGLYDTLAVAREAAQVARTNEDRSRKSLYDAVGRAYDFSLEAEANPDDFAELIEENGLAVQDRAPMTPIVKLVFGADYDKTRLTEYAAVLSYAHRTEVSRGNLSEVLRTAEGGLKGIVQAERRARREEAGETVDTDEGVREKLAKQLRALDPVELEDIDPDGAEFALVMVRRTADGEIELVGEVPEDVPLVERAARKLLS